jgi:hypothetical protein
MSNRRSLLRLTVAFPWATANSAIDASINRSARLRQAILKWEFEGKLVPQDAADDAAAALLERIRTANAAASRPEAQADSAEKPRERGLRAWRGRKK